MIICTKTMRNIRPLQKQYQVITVSLDSFRTWSSILSTRSGHVNVYKTTINLNDINFQACGLFHFSVATFLGLHFPEFLLTCMVSGKRLSSSLWSTASTPWLIPLSCVTTLTSTGKRTDMKLLNKTESVNIVQKKIKNKHLLQIMSFTFYQN